jgi:molecular chaperone DnaK
MVNEAESHADEDKKRKEVVEARNHADSLVHSTESNLKEHSDKISEEDKLIIETSLQELKTLLEGEDPDPDEIKTKSDALSEQAMKLGEAMYKASQAEAADGENEEVSSGEEAIDDADVVDAEFEEVNTDEDQPNEENKKNKKAN